MSDVSLVAELFERSGGKLISVEVITAVRQNGTTMHSYTERIANVRSKWQCKCGDDPKYCKANKHIVNIKPGWFKFQSTRLALEAEESVPVLQQEKIDYKQIYLDAIEQYRKESDSFKKELIKQKGIVAKKLWIQQQQDMELLEATRKALI